MYTFHYKSEKNAISLRYLYKIWHDDAERVSRVHRPLKHLVLKIQDGGRTTNTLERPVLYHHEILQFVDFQHGGCPPFWNFEIEILTAVRFRDKFCVIVVNFVEIGKTAKIFMGHLFAATCTCTRICT